MPRQESVLNKEEIIKLIEKKELVKNYIDLDTQLTPNGFDLTAANIFEFKDQGALDFSNKERKVPAGKEILPRKENPKDRFGWWQLKRGCYKVLTNEAVNLPLDLVALSWSRTSLLRMGAFTAHGVWDAGFHGRGEFILAVENIAGIKIKQNARIAQLIFLKTNRTKEGYSGIYSLGDGSSSPYPLSLNELQEAQ